MPARRSLLWTIAGAFLLTVVAGTLVQAFVAVAVLRPLESRETRSRAELTASSLAAEIATAPAAPSGAALDTLLDRHRARLGGRAAWVAYRGAGGVVTAPARRETLAAALPAIAADTTFERTVTRGSRRVRELVVRRGVARGGVPAGEVLAVRPALPSGGFGRLDWPATLLAIPIAGSLIAIVREILLYRRDTAAEA